jgi:hypothetical protein
MSTEKLLMLRAIFPLFGDNYLFGRPPCAMLPPDINESSGVCRPMATVGQSWRHPVRVPYGDCPLVIAFSLSLPSKSVNADILLTMPSRGSSSARSRDWAEIAPLSLKLTRKRGSQYRLPVPLQAENWLVHCRG